MIRYQGPLPPISQEVPESATEKNVKKNDESQGDQNKGASRKPCGPVVPDWILEKYAGQHVALTMDGGTVLAAAVSGGDVVRQLDREGRDRGSYFVMKIYPANTVLVL
ncbi:MAG: hypothetical protein HY000_04175 [Planctomycetes bacterium]|nr:hypothetical protein [Planctomycetota bacterium]